MIHPRKALLALTAVLTLVATALLGIVTTAPALASHYRANQLTWHAGASPNQVAFHLTGSWRCTFYVDPCTVAPGDTLTQTSIDPGDGVGYVDIELKVVSVDVTNDVVTAEGEADYTYASAGPFVAFSDDCCRLSDSGGHINNPDGDVRFETLVDLAATSASPVGLVPPIVDCPVNAVCTFSVPASDPDNQPMAWRLSTADEAGVGFTQPTGASINAGTGLYTWDTTGATLASTGSTFYSTQVMVENVVGGNVVSRTAVDFFIRLGSNSTNNQPVFTNPTPANGATINGSIGAPLTFGVAASDPDSADTVTPSILGAPAGSTFTPTAGNPASATFSWTPGAAGDYSVTLLATDDHGLGAVPRTITLHITTTPVNPPPVVDAGADRLGKPGVAVSLDGTVTDTEPVTTHWTATPAAGNDPASTCSFGDANAVDTTITCTGAGTWTLELTADDGTNPVVSDTATLVVNPPPTVDAGSDRTSQEGVAITLDATVSDTEPVTTHWTAIAGAGVASGATCTFGNAAAVDTTVSCTDDGTWTLKLTADDGTNPPVSDTATLTVSDPAPVVDAGANASSTEGATVPLDATVTDTEPTSVQWSATAGAGVDAGATCTFGSATSVDTTVSCTDDGTWTLKLEASDGNNPAVSDTLTLALTNAAPTVAITAPASGAAFATSASVAVSADLGDAGKNDSHTCSISWGDGTTTPGTVQAGHCTGSHAYSAAGSRTITVTATDDDGGSGQASVTVTVSAPTVEKLKVTGGGFVKPSKNDKTSFGFVARTKGSGFAGSIVVRHGDDKLKGTTVSDLEVNGRTATWKGTGRWNGTKGYTFKVEVKDRRHGTKGAPDEFSITVKSPTGAVVLTVSGQLAGGKIVIH